MKLQTLYLIIEKMQYKKFGNFIREKRMQMGKKLNSFALDCDIDKASLSNFERNKCGICFDSFLKIAKGFNLLPSQLLQEYEKQYSIDNSQWFPIEHIS